MPRYDSRPFACVYAGPEFFKQQSTETDETLSVVTLLKATLKDIFPGKIIDVRRTTSLTYPHTTYHLDVEAQDLLFHEFCTKTENVLRNVPVCKGDKKSATTANGKAEIYDNPGKEWIPFPGCDYISFWSEE